MALLNRRGLLLVLLLVVAIVLPPYLGIYYTRFATQIAIYGMAALSVDLLLGYTGLITFGQAALFGVGAYAAGMLTVSGLTNASQVSAGGRFSLAVHVEPWVVLAPAR